MNFSLEIKNKYVTPCISVTMHFLIHIIFFCFYAVKLIRKRRDILNLFNNLSVIPIYFTNLVSLSLLIPITHRIFLES